MKQSGLGREGSKYGMDEYLEVRIRILSYILIKEWQLLKGSINPELVVSCVVNGIGYALHGVDNDMI